MAGGVGVGGKGGVDLCLCDLNGNVFGVGGVFFFFFFFFFFFGLFRTTPMAYGCSQARGRIRATAASHSHSQSHSNARSEPRLPPTPLFSATQDP